MVKALQLADREPEPARAPAPLSSVRSARGLAWLLTVGGVVGLAAAFQLTIDKIELLRDPDAVFACNLNAFVSCRGVMSSTQAEVFGFPSSIIGIAGFSVVATIGVLALLRTNLPALMWLGMQAAATFGVAFVTWLQYESIFRIGSLCPYCMVVWVVMIAIFVYLSGSNIERFVPGRYASLVAEWSLLIVLLWLVAVSTTIWFQFGSSLWA
jgi:uncharacterized membrane protein